MVATRGNLWYRWSVSVDVWEADAFVPKWRIAVRDGLIHLLQKQHEMKGLRKCRSKNNLLNKRNGKYKQNWKIRRRKKLKRHWKNCKVHLVIPDWAQETSRILRVGNIRGTENHFGRGALYDVRRRSLHVVLFEYFCGVKLRKYFFKVDVLNEAYCAFDLTHWRQRF